MEYYQLRNKARNGLILIITGCVFGGIETVCFGNNWLPQSGAERVCDGISEALTMVGLIMFCTALRERLKDFE